MRSKASGKIHNKNYPEVEAEDQERGDQFVSFVRQQ